MFRFKDFLSHCYNRRISLRVGSQRAETPSSDSKLRMAIGHKKLPNLQGTVTAYA